MRIGYVVVFLFALCACQSSETSNAAFVDQDHIHQAYVAEYNENTGEYYASACFRFGGPNGTTLVVDSTGSVSFDGKKMNRTRFLMGGAFYRLNYIDSTGPAEATHLFNWLNDNKEVIQNKAMLYPLAIGPLPDSFPLSADVQLGIQAPQMHDSEIIVVEIADTATTARFKFAKQDIKNGTITLYRKALQGINGDKGTLSAERVLEVPLQEATKAGGQVKTRYRSRDREIKFSRKTDARP